jgi:hypothetical protein
MKNLKPMYIAVDEQIRIVCSYSQVYEGWCKGCLADVEMITFAEAANIICSSVDRVIQRAAKGGIHLGVRPEAMLVCMNSLLRDNPSVSPAVRAKTGKEKNIRSVTV